MLVGITGDTHGDLNFSQVYKARREKITHLIVCGDFGYIWDGSMKEQKQLDYLNKIGVKILFIDGNHENHVLLNNYPMTEMYGGRVHKIRENIIYLIRGEVYVLNGDKYFVFGGANSTDIEYRIEGKSWWKEEKPSEEDRHNAYKNLEKNNFNVGYVITHTCYPLALNYVGGDIRIDDVSDYLNFIRHKTNFKHWFFGHMHRDYTISYFNTSCIYKEIVIID